MIWSVTSCRHFHKQLVSTRHMKAEDERCRSRSSHRTLYKHCQSEGKKICIFYLAPTCQNMNLKRRWKTAHRSDLFGRRSLAGASGGCAHRVRASGDALLMVASDPREPLARQRLCFNAIVKNGAMTTGRYGGGDGAVALPSPTRKQA